MLYLIVGLLIVLVLILIVLIIILAKNSKVVEKHNFSESSKDFYFHLPSFINKDKILEKNQKSFGLYKTIDYKNNSDKRFSDIDWSTLEVLYLLAQINEKKYFYFDEVDQFTPDKYIINDKNKILAKVSRIYFKYQNHTKDGFKDEKYYSKKYIFTGSEVYALFKYMKYLEEK